MKEVGEQEGEGWEGQDRREGEKEREENCENGRGREQNRETERWVK